jgi:hypothetical protein
MEHITAFPSEGAKGKRYRGPHWFFREADKGYWRSEFVVMAPKDRPVEIETVGKVPAPKTQERGPFVAPLQAHGFSEVIRQHEMTLEL